MGQENSKISNEFDKFDIPKEKLFRLSYIPQKNIKEIVKQDESVNLIKILDEYKYNIPLIMQFLYYQLKHGGYRIKPSIIDFPCISIDEILSNFNKIVTDIDIRKEFYEPNLNNIYYFLNRGKILLALIILDNEFLTESLKQNGNDNKIVTDVVLIVGYNNDNIIIKHKWSRANTLEISNKFISNIRELWNIEINTNNY